MPDAPWPDRPRSPALDLIAAAMWASSGSARRFDQLATWCSFLVIVLGALTAATSGASFGPLPKCTALGVVCAGAGRVVFEREAATRSRSADQYRRMLEGKAPR